MIRSLVTDSHSLVALPPVLEFTTATTFDLVWNDKGSGADRDGAFYQPQAPEGWYILGDYGQGNYNSPAGTVLLIRVVDNDDPEHPALKAPLSWAKVWDDKGSGAKEDGSFWAPVPPFGYVACGHVVAKGHASPPTIPQFRCLRYDLSTSVELGNAAQGSGLIWNDQGSGADADVAIYRVPSLGVFWAIPNYSAPTERANVPSVLINT